MADLPLQKVSLDRVVVVGVLVQRLAGAGTKPKGTVTNSGTQSQRGQSPIQAGTSTFGCLPRLRNVWLSPIRAEIFACQSVDPNGLPR